MQAFAGATTPEGWLLCDGSAVSRTDYANLFSVIGTTYGDGDGSTTFNVPDLVDKFVEGSATAGTVKSAGLPDITGFLRTIHAPTDGTTGAFKIDDETWTVKNMESSVTTYGVLTPYQSADFKASRSSSIYGNSNTVQPPAVTMRYIIKY